MSTFLIHRSFAFLFRVKIINYESILFGCRKTNYKRQTRWRVKWNVNTDQRNISSQIERSGSPQRDLRTRRLKYSTFDAVLEGKVHHCSMNTNKRTFPRWFRQLCTQKKETVFLVKHSDWALDVVDREHLSCRHPNRTDWRRCHPTVNSSYPCRSNPVSSMVSSHYCCHSDYLSIEARPRNANESFVCDRRLHRVVECILVDCVERRRSCTLPWRLQRDPWRYSPRNHVDTSISSMDHSRACWQSSDQDWSACFCHSRSSFDTEARRDQLSIRSRTALGRTLWQQVAGRSVVWEPA